ALRRPVVCRQDDRSSVGHDLRHGAADLAAVEAHADHGIGPHQRRVGDHPVERAWRLVSSSSSVYSWISPPTSERRPAAMVPPSPRLRTTSPKTWPFVSATRWPATNGAVETITLPPFRLPV